MKKNNFRQHIPAFMDIGEPYKFDFDTLEELLNYERISRFKDERFHKFVLSDNLLMVLYDNGNDWWVIGFIKHPELLEGLIDKWEGAPKTSEN